MGYRVFCMGFALIAQGGFAATLPDPTRPPDFVAEEPMRVIPAEVVDWKLSGVTISSSARSAILNDRLVLPGQSIGPATVLEIRARSILLDYNGETVEVELRGQVVKRPAASTPP